MSPLALLLCIVGAAIGVCLLVFIAIVVFSFIVDGGGIIILIIGGVIAICFGQWWGFVPLIIGIIWFASIPRPPHDKYSS